jgi:hypothetical protein
MDDHATMVIEGDPEAIEALLSVILQEADLADERGDLDAADRLAAIIPEIQMMKAAQYESGQGYWIANGRAFELAFKRHVDEAGDEFSFHEAWGKALEEWSDSLLAGQGDFNEKKLKTAQYEGFRTHWLANSRAFELAFKRRVEAQEDGEPSFCEAWIETLDEFQDGLERNDFASKNIRTAAKNDQFLDRVRKEANRRGKTLSETYLEWQGHHEACMKALLKKVGSKIEEGKSPGVAIHESIESFRSGRHAQEVIERLGASKDWWTWGWLGEKAKGLGGKALEWAKGTPEAKAAKAVEKAESGMKKKLDELRVRMLREGGLHPGVVYKALSDIFKPLAEFYRAVGIEDPDNFKGGATEKGIALRPMPYPNKWDYVDPKTELMTQRGFIAYEGDLNAAIEAVLGAAQDVKDESKAPPMMGTKPKTQEEQLAEYQAELAKQQEEQLAKQQEELAKQQEEQLAKQEEAKQEAEKQRAQAEEQRLKSGSISLSRTFNELSSGIVTAIAGTGRTWQANITAPENLDAIAVQALKDDPDINGAATVVLSAMMNDSGLENGINKILPEIASSRTGKGQQVSARIQSEIRNIKKEAFQNIVATLNRLYGYMIPPGTASASRIVKSLIQTANRLDEEGQTEEADQVDRVASAISRGDPRAPEMLEALGGKGIKGWIEGLSPLWQAVVAMGALTVPATPIAYGLLNIALLGNPIPLLATAAVAGATMKSPKMRKAALDAFFGLEDAVARRVRSLAEKMRADAFLYSPETTKELNELAKLLGKYGNDEILALAGGDAEAKRKALSSSIEAVKLARQGGGDFRANLGDALSKVGEMSKIDLSEYAIEKIIDPVLEEREGGQLVAEAFRDTLPQQINAEREARFLEKTRGGTSGTMGELEKQVDNDIFEACRLGASGYEWLGDQCTDIFVLLKETEWPDVSLPEYEDSSPDPSPAGPAGPSEEPPLTPSPDISGTEFERIIAEEDPPTGTPAVQTEESEVPVIGPDDAAQETPLPVPPPTPEVGQDLEWFYASPFLQYVLRSALEDAKEYKLGTENNYLEALVSNLPSPKKDVSLAEVNEEEMAGSLLRHRVTTPPPELIAASAIEYEANPQLMPASAQKALI